MKVSIKTIKITSVISALSLVIALLMGAEYFKDASQIYLFGISWVTLQNTAFGIFGSAALAAVSAGIIYGVDKEAYLNKSEQYLIHVCTKSKTAFVQLTEANKILENGILSKNEKATFTGVSTIVSFIETQQEAIQPASMQFLFKRSQVASYNALLCRCHEVTQGLIQLSNKLQVKYGHWEINDAVKNAAQSSTGLDSPLLDEAKSCSEEDFLVSRNRRNALWAKHSSPVLRQKRMPQTRASFCISSLNFTSLLILIRILLFPFLQLLLSLFAGVEFLNFGHEKAGEGINDGLRQFNLVWIQTFFLAGHGVLPRQQTPSGST